MKKLTALTALTVAIVAVLAGAFSVTAAAGGRGTTREVVARQTSSVEVVPPDAPGVLGARFLGSDDLFVDGELVGRGGRSCEAVGGDGSGSALFLCTIALELDGGLLTAQGFTELREGQPGAFTAAITGGTGDHSKARGTLEAHQTSETEITYVVGRR